MGLRNAFARGDSARQGRARGDALRIDDDGYVVAGVDPNVDGLRARLYSDCTWNVPTKPLRFRRLCQVVPRPSPV